MELFIPYFESISLRHHTTTYPPYAPGLTQYFIVHLTHQIRLFNFIFNNAFCYIDIFWLCYWVLSSTKLCFVLLPFFICTYFLCSCFELISYSNYTEARILEPNEWCRVEVEVRIDFHWNAIYLIFHFNVKLKSSIFYYDFPHDFISNLIPTINPPLALY